MRKGKQFMFFIYLKGWGSLRQFIVGFYDVRHDNKIELATLQFAGYTYI